MCQGDAPAEEEDEAVVTRQAYAATAQARVRRLRMQDVPSLEAASLDFIFIRQLRVDSSVDQQAEIESVLGLMWGLVRGGGYFGVLHDVNQIIVVVDSDGGLWEHLAGARDVKLTYADVC